MHAEVLDLFKFTERQRRRVLEILPLLLICIALAAYALVSAVDLSRLAESMEILNHEQMLLDHDSELIPQNEPEPTILNIRLPDSFAQERSICFHSVYQEVRVDLDGREIYSFLKPEGEKLMKAAPNYWNQMVLPAGSSGRLLQIQLSTPYQQYAGVLPQVRGGTPDQVERYINMQTIPRFAAAITILMVGMVFAAGAVVMRYYVVGKTGLYSLSLFIVVLAVFLAAQQTSILLKINDRTPYILIQSLALMLCPMMYCRYLIRLHKGWLKRLDECLFAIGAGNFAVVLALQLIGAADMPQLMIFTRILCAALIVYAFIQEVSRRRRLLICLYALMLVYAAILYYFTDTIAWVVYAALFMYLYLTIYRIILSVSQSQANQIRLAAQLEVSRSEIATIQITSHFFYHTLDSIRALIRLDADQAYKMTGDFAKYLRHRVDGVERMQETVPFSRELRSIRAYTDIKKAQLGDRFTMIFDVETEDFEILPLTVQPLVENAVIHAVQLRREGGIVRLICREEKDGYRIQVIDNGPGAAAPPEAADEQKQSSAMRNVNTRLEFYGIAPPVYAPNEWGGMTVTLKTPKRIRKKGNAE